MRLELRVILETADWEIVNWETADWETADWETADQETVELIWWESQYRTDWDEIADWEWE